MLVLQLLLGYLPSDRALWEQELAKKRSQYAAFKEEFLSNPVCPFRFRFVTFSILIVILRYTCGVV
jgi:hypothetical protein